MCPHLDPGNRHSPPDSPIAPRRDIPPLAPCCISGAQSRSSFAHTQRQSVCQAFRRTSQRRLRAEQVGNAQNLQIKDTIFKRSLHFENGCKTSWPSAFDNVASQRATPSRTNERSTRRHHLRGPPRSPNVQCKPLVAAATSPGDMNVSIANELVQRLQTPQPVPVRPLPCRSQSSGTMIAPRQNYVTFNEALKGERHAQRLLCDRSGRRRPVHSQNALDQGSRLRH